MPSETDPKGRLPRLGVRREAAILLPVSLLVLIGLSTFTLFSLRTTLEQWQESEQRRALALANRVLDQLGQENQPGSSKLQAIKSRTGSILSLSVLDERGLALAEVGSVAPLDLRHPLDLAREQPITVGPDQASADRLIVLATLARHEGQETTWLRLDLEANTLSALLRSLPLLTALVLAVNAAVMALGLLFLRHLFAPIDSLLEKARSVAGEEPFRHGEVEFLVETFDRALAALNKGAETEVEDDIAALRRALSPSLESGLLMLDRTGSVLALNQIGSDLLGCHLSTPPEALDSVLAPHPALVSVLLGCVRGERGAQRLESSVEVDGRNLTLGLTVHPLRRQDASLRAWLVLFADLTQVQKRAQEERLSQSLLQIGQLTAGLAHELRNSLASLRGYLTLIERTQDAAETSEYLGEIKHETDHLQRVLEDFLAFAKPGSKRPARLDLDRLIRRATQDPALQELGSPIKIKSLDKAPFVGDAQLLERALRNLLHNAARAQAGAGAAPGSEVEVALSASEKDEEWLITVSDRGPGLSEEVKANLFVPFNTAEPGGVGLGLALSRRIVELHGGRLSLENRQGGGACATVYLPFGEAATNGNDFAESS